MHMEVKSIVVLGYGQRGQIYANYALANPEEFQVVAIIETDEARRNLAKSKHDCPVFSDYKDFLNEKIKADVVAIATQDADHKEHAIACMECGYDLLLEKPIANTLEDCMAIYEASVRLQRKVIVCHVLRYTPFYQKIKEIIQSGELGDVITMNMSENVGFYHQAHSFVRGPWRNTEEACPMILAKCCHDLDIMRWLVDEPCEGISSFGDLSFFKEENAPAGSAQYCSDCRVPSCAYRAKKLYAEYPWMRGYFCCDIHNDQVANDALVHSPYDRCVFKCDNDVMDHQVSIFRFRKNITAMHTMTAFSKEIYRDIKVHGTKAELYGVMEKNILELRVFGGETIRYDFKDMEISGNHGGGDNGLMHNLFLERNGVVLGGITYLDVSIDSHKMAFGAEESRKFGKTVVL